MNPRPTAVTALLLLAVGLTGPAAAQPAASAPPAAPRIEVLFVLDSTGSMSSEIREAKDRILAIAESIASGEPRPDVRFGIVTYRDRGDAYVTKRWPLTRDWAATKAALATIRADGGGDTPESVIQALHEGIRDTEWTLAQDVMKVVYLIGDAPPKLYDDDPDYAADLRWALDNGVVVQAIGCGGIGRRGADFFRDVAVATEGHYHPISARARRAVTADEVRGVEESAPRRATPESLAAVVERTARTYSGELGVAYDEAEAEPVPTTWMDESLPRRHPDGSLLAASGLAGEHVRVVSDAATWRRVWAVHTSTWPTPTAPPPVDFHDESVIVASVASGGIATVGASRHGDTLFVGVTRRPTGPRVELARIPAWDGPVRVVTDADPDRTAVAPSHAGGE